MILRIFTLCFLIFTSISFGQEEDKEDKAPSKIERQMQLIIPRFTVSGTMEEVIEALKKKVKEVDPEENNFVVIYRPFQEYEYKDVDGKPEGFSAFEEAEDDPFAEPIEGEESVLVPPKKFKVDFKQMTVLKIVKYLSLISDSIYKVDENAVIIADPRLRMGGEVMSYVEVTPAEIALLRMCSSEELTEDEQKDINNVLKVLGIKSFLGYETKYISSINRLIVTTTYEELKKLNQLLSEIRGQLTFEKKAKMSYDKIKEPLVSKDFLKVIPEVRLESKSLVDTIGFLQQEIERQKLPINIILKFSGNSNVNISLDADDIPIIEMVKYICEHLELEFSVDDNVVLIGDINVHIPLEVKIFKYPKVLNDLVGKKKDIAYRRLFENLGAEFSHGSSLKVVSDYQYIVSWNTPKNHKVLSMYIRAYNEEERSSTQHDLLNTIVPHLQYEGGIEALVNILIELTINKDPDHPRLNVISKGLEAYDKKVSLDFRNVPIKEILKSASDSLGFTIQVEEHAVVLSSPSYVKPTVKTEEKLRELMAKPLEFQEEIRQFRDELSEIDRTLVHEEKLKNRPIEQALKVTIPKVSFTNYSMLQVIEFVTRNTKELSESGKAVNIFMGPMSKDYRINLDASKIPAGEVLRYVCDQVGLTYEVNDYSVTIRESK
ncbi:MAG: hypothetical protein NE330_11130 [Lentisphaeraceae bacterium]|nr:hypothetical protein [Lentisphaeraceae bacterium]